MNIINGIVGALIGGSLVWVLGRAYGEGVGAAKSLFVVGKKAGNEDIKLYIDHKIARDGFITKMIFMQGLNDQLDDCIEAIDSMNKKQKLDRDDVSDITSFDVVSWLRNEMRYKLNRELALAYVLGDGRQAASEDKIDENCIRPIFNDADLFTIKVQVATTGLSKVEDKYKAFIKQVIRSRKEYRGSGTPAMFTTEDALTEMLLLEDGMGRPLYADEAALARKLRVSKIVTVPEMDGRKGAKGGDLAAVIVNLRDYTVGADKGGAVSMFDDFDIDYNAMKYLIETRCSGALTTPYSAMAIEWAAA